MSGALSTDILSYKKGNDTWTKDMRFLEILMQNKKCTIVHLHRKFILIGVVIFMIDSFVEYLMRHTVYRVINEKVSYSVPFCYNCNLLLSNRLWQGQQLVCLACSKYVLLDSSPRTHWRNHSSILQSGLKTLEPSIM